MRFKLKQMKTGTGTGAKELQLPAGKVKVDQVHFINVGADICQMKLAQMLIDDMKKFDSSQIYGQKIPHSKILVLKNNPFTLLIFITQKNSIFL